MRFHKLEEHLRTPVGAHMMGIGRGSADFAQLIRDAQKFYVGDVCLFEGMMSPGDFPRLPYPMCIFEFQDSDPKDVKRPFFILAEELGASDPNVDAARVHCFTPYPLPNKEALWLHSGYLEINRKKSNHTDCIINKATLELLGAGEGFPALADKNKISDSIFAAVTILSVFLSVLNCSNVEVAEVVAPMALNKKRLQKSKVPIYSYKVLVLKTRQQKLLNGYGTHESPRIHLRRGHIKRRKTGNFWWEPCVVGDRKKGIVVKDYKFELEPHHGNA